MVIKKILIKNGLLLIILLLSYKNLLAQTVDFGVTGGINFPTISAYDNPTNSIDRSKTYSNIKIGELTHISWPKFTIQTGLLLDGKGGKDIYINPETNTNRQKNSRIYYLEIPVNFLYRLAAKVGDIFLGGGPYVAYGLWGNYSLSGIIFDSDVDGSNKIQFGNNENSDFKRFDYGVNASAKIRLLHGIGFEVNYEYGLRDIASPGIYDDVNLKTRNKVFGIVFSTLSNISNTSFIHETLVLIRHAQAEINQEGISDFERPLTKSGEQEAVKIVQLLKETEITPQIFISSTALRALTTANIFTDALNLKTPETAIEIYEANVPALLKVVTQLDNKNDVVALVGHNPGISNLLYYLTGKITTMPTSAFAIVELAANNWNEVSSGTGTLIQYSFP